MPEHVTITDPDIHEPKGASTANVDEVYVADGIGSGDWQILNPYGGFNYNDITGSGTTYTTPTTYTLLNLAGSATNLNNFTFNSLGRLTYTGTTARHSHAVIDCSYKHSSGAGNDVTFAIYKNGVIFAPFEAVGSADSTNFQRMVLHFDAMMVENDYFEVYAKTPAGNVIIYCLYFFMMGMPG